MSFVPEWAKQGRRGWRYTGQERPDFAIPPGPGQESVWDYPRPPRIDPDGREIVVQAGAIVIARSQVSLRVLETASPPTFYIPPGAIERGLLRPRSDGSQCEWKGEGRYWDVMLPDRCVQRAAWSYEEPFPGFESIAGYLAFYPALVECSVGGVRVEPQPGQFYGGWVTQEVVGPFKGEPGSEGW